MKACYYCKGTQLEKRLVTVDYRWGDDLHIIEDVPAKVCRQCGERYFSAEVSEAMEDVALKGKNEIAKKSVPVHSLKKAV